MNQWRTRSQYCAKRGAWITGSWSVKATSGWQLQAASCSPGHSPAGTVASPRNRALGTPRRCSRLTEWRRPCAAPAGIDARRPTTIGGLSRRPLTKKGACSRLAQSPPASRPNPTGSVFHAAPAAPRPALPGAGLCPRGAARRSPRRPGQIASADQSCSQAAGQVMGGPSSSLPIVHLAARAAPPCRAWLHDDFASLDPAATPLDLGACEKDEVDRQPEPQPQSEASPPAGRALARLAPPGQCEQHRLRFGQTRNER